MVQLMDKNIAVIGATGNVGRKCIEIILQRQLITTDKIQLFASKKSAGKKLAINAHEFVIHDTESIDFNEMIICLFATECSVSKIYVPKALASGSFIIDSSSLYRLDASVPLIVAPVNKDLVSIQKTRLYAIANCIASPIAIVLKPLHDALIIKHVNIVTYQSTSGAGKASMDELWSEAKELCSNKQYQRQYFSRQIAFNVIPQIDKLLADGYTYEEYKIMHEILKIIATTFAITATSVRVPVMVGHAVALSIEFATRYDLPQIHSILSQAPGVKLSQDNYTTPVEIVGSDDVYVGRIRRDQSVSNGLHLWVCSDNLRRGAATDMVEVAEELLTQLQHQSAPSPLAEKGM